MTSRASKPPRRVAIVAAGAGARGAFEAGALSIVLPWLEAQQLTPNVFVGTSAGAINASLMAATVHLGADASAAELLRFWNEVRLSDIVRGPLHSGPKTIIRYLGQLAGAPRSRVQSVLDTSPMVPFAQAIFEPLATALRDNVASGRVQALALAATSSAERTTVFCDVPPGHRLPAANLGRAIDYEPTQIDYRHVLASSAIPALFLPIEIDGQWFTDGGVRLNVPLAPAVAFRADDLVVVATHPEQYVQATVPPSSHRPDVVDAIASILGSALSDRMVEDLHTLDKRNRLAGQGAGGSRTIRRAFVGPNTRGELGDLATSAYATRTAGPLASLTDELALVHLLLGRAERSNGDILSYLFFEPEYTTAAIELGQRYAQNQLLGLSPWVS